MLRSNASSGNVSSGQRMISVDSDRLVSDFSDHEIHDVAFRAAALQLHADGGFDFIRQGALRDFLDELVVAEDQSPADRLQQTLDHERRVFDDLDRALRRAAVRGARVRIRHLDYDWNLNDLPRKPPSPP